MAKGVVTKSVDVFSTVKFSTKFHQLEFVDCGAGLAVMAPEWEGMALVLTKEDTQKLQALCQLVTSRP